ncbi:MORN repeat-containing protein [Faustovirus ST1]|nr:MORN repeat-containing protein [Faustovirus ST1]
MIFFDIIYQEHMEKCVLPCEICIHIANYTPAAFNVFRRLCWQLNIALSGDVAAARVRFIVRKRISTGRFIHNFSVNPHGEYEGVYEIIDKEAALVTERRNYINGVYHGNYWWHDTNDYGWIDCNYNMGKIHGEFKQRLFRVEEGWVLITANYVNDMIHGKHTVELYKCGGLIKIDNYVNGVKTGVCKKYYGDARQLLKSTAYYLNGEKHGEKIYYDMEQQQTKIEYYHHGKLIVD